MRSVRHRPLLIAAVAAGAAFLILNRPGRRETEPPVSPPVPASVPHKATTEELEHPPSPSDFARQTDGGLRRDKPPAPAAPEPMSSEALPLPGDAGVRGSAPVSEEERQVVSQALRDLIARQTSLEERTRKRSPEDDAAGPGERLFERLKEQQTLALKEAEELRAECAGGAREVPALSQVSKRLKKIISVMYRTSAQIESGLTGESAEGLAESEGKLLDLLEWLDLEEERVLEISPDASEPLGDRLDVFERRRLRRIPELDPERRRTFDRLDETWRKAEGIYQRNGRMRRMTGLASRPDPSKARQEEFLLSELSIEQSRLEDELRSVLSRPAAAFPSPAALDRAQEALRLMKGAREALLAFDPRAALRSQRSAAEALRAAAGEP